MKSIKKSFQPKGLITLLITGWLLMQSPLLFCQTPAEYHFVYIDISKTEDFGKLQEQLDTLFARIKDQKFVFYLSNGNKPVVVTEARQFHKIQSNISNLTTSLPKLDKDIENINRVFNENDFLRLSREENTKEPVITPIYDKVVWHFFFSPALLSMMSIDRQLISFLLLENFANNNSPKPSVILNFEKDEMKSVNRDDLLYLERSGYEIFKY